MDLPSHTTRTGCAAALAALAFALAGCASHGPMQHADRRTGDSTAPPTMLINEKLIESEKQQRAERANRNIAKLVVLHPAPYKIGPGDILSIVVWDHPELAGPLLPATAAVADSGTPGVPSPGFVLDHEGRIQFPFAGQLKLAGLTEEEARRLLAARIATFIAKPNVTLRVQAYRSKRIYIDGEVKTPGLQAINDIPMSLLEALNRAGGLLPTADQSRIMLERGEARYHIDMRELVAKGINPGNLMLVSGDVLRVSSRDESKVFVSGEVVSPKALTMHNGSLSLNEALGESGGISLTGDARQVYVVRKGVDGTRVYQLDARQADALAMAEAFELHPKDLVYVAASPLANWHRSLSMIFPGALTSVVGVTTRP